MEQDEIEQIIKIMLDLPSRVFGETLVEPIIREVFGDEKNKKRIFDSLRTTDNGCLNGEIKEVRVVLDNENQETLYEYIKKYKPISERIGTIDDILNGSIIANFQNIKLNKDGEFDFDYLDYVLVDKNGFHIFEMSREKFKEGIMSGEFARWCDKHGSKETGLNGQFVIDFKTYDWHSKFLIKYIPWKDIIEISKRIKMSKNQKRKNAKIIK